MVCTVSGMCFPSEEVSFFSKTESQIIPFLNMLDILQAEICVCGGEMGRNRVYLCLL